MRTINDYNSYLKRRFGEKVYRIAVDAGFSCPNRDGAIATGGCLFCNAVGARAAYVKNELDVRAQIEDRISYLKAMKAAKKFVVYFQAFTNTYAPVEKLRQIYDAILPFKEIVGLSIGTRPDCVDEPKMKLISSYAKDREVWIEYGMQSSHDGTLKTINRGHDFASFVDAVKLAKKYRILVTAHVILGLPGETREMMLETANRLNELKIDGVKIHLLHVLKGSALEKEYGLGKVKLLEQGEYVRLTADFLEMLDPDIVIQRLTGEGDKNSHIAPEWAMDKIGTINKIIAEMDKRHSWQGKVKGKK